MIFSFKLHFEKHGVCRTTLHQNADAPVYFKAPELAEALAASSPNSMYSFRHVSKSPRVLAA
jgi:hypothetical protein